MLLMLVALMNLVMYILTNSQIHFWLCASATILIFITQEA